MVGPLLVVAVCAAAAVVGQGDGRRAAVFVGVLLGAACIVRTIMPEAAGQAMAFVADVALTIALATLAWKPRRPWPLLLMGLQGLIVALDLLRWLEPGVRPSSFAVATGFVWVAMAAVLINAAITSRREGLSPS